MLYFHLVYLFTRVKVSTKNIINIPRNENLEHIHIKGLFPCGEGGGYAGGIVSAAMDGERCAEAAIKMYK